MSFDIDFRGRLQKIRAPIPASLQAVFEAVANAFDATELLRENGRITVRILHKQLPPDLYSDKGAPQFAFDGFEIEDNGVGFTDEHLMYFKKSDTTNKVGGKGVGRFLWLKVFDQAEIVSVYEKEGLWWKREFTFSVEKNGVDDNDTAPGQIERGESPGTKVRLVSPKPERISTLAISPKPLAIKLLEHFLLYFTVLRGQTLTVVDDITNEEVAVGDLYKEVIEGRHKEEEFGIRNCTFVLHHLFVKPTTTRKNLIKLCANRRVVTSEFVSPFVPEVGRADAVTVQGSFRYHAYVTGSYLDEIADDERATLRFPYDVEKKENSQNEEELPFAEEEPSQEQVIGITKRELLNCIAERIRVHLKDHIAEVRRKKERQLENFAAHEQPQFRPFVELAKKNLDRLPSRPSKKDIELVLCEAKIDGRSQLQTLVEEIVASQPSIGQVDEYRKQLIERFVTEANRYNQSALAEYVCARKAVIQVLKANLGKNEVNENELETSIHNLFFPRFHTSDQLAVGPKDSGERDIDNLWLIDERLVFHRLLSSDQPLSRLRGFLRGETSEKDDEPDIVIFDPAFVTTEGDELRSIGIVEFKRPGRTQYTEDKNPIKQIIDIATDLRSGSIEDKDGRIQAISNDVRVYGYAICDATDKLKKIAENTYDMRQTPDGMGYYLYHQRHNLIIELIPYSKLVCDADRRNEAFFKKLGL